MCNFGVINVSSSSCISDQPHIWSKYTYFLCNDHGRRCANPQQTESEGDPNAVGSRCLGPCYVCTQLDFATKARDRAVAEAREIIRRAEEAYAVAEIGAYQEVKEVRPVRESERSDGRRKGKSRSEKYRESKSGRGKPRLHGYYEDDRDGERRDRNYGPAHRY